MPAVTGPARRPLVARFVDLVGPVEDYEACIPWTAAMVGPNGYGAFNGTTAHRSAYQFFVGDTPDDSHKFTVDHLCRNRACVNPFHLELVPHEENSRRGKGSITHCAQGHEFTPENTGWEGRGPNDPKLRRRCLTCKRQRLREGDARFKAEARNRCVDCGKAIYRDSTRCLSCSAIEREARR